MERNIDIDISSIFVDRIAVSVGDVFYLLSMVVDYLVPKIHAHHLSVALISFEMATKMGLKESDVEDIVGAALVHDIGIGFMGVDIKSPSELEGDYKHARKGFELLSKVSWMRNIADIVLHHHDSWRGPNESGIRKDQIPIGSRVIFLADMVDVRATVDNNCSYFHSGGDICKPLNAKEDVVRYVRENAGILFDPEVVAALESVAKREAFWFGIEPVVVESLAREILPEKKRFLPIEEVIGAYSLLAEIVDAKSPFTRSHSTNVASLSAYIGRKMNFSEMDVELQMIGGLLHDLGKIAVPSFLLNKPGRLTKQEFNIMKSHPYITHLILKKIPALRSIDAIASLHHEKLNGKGYPFRFDKRRLSLGARAMTVADIFSALYERRPYRSSLTFEETVDIMTKMAKRNEIDSDILSIVVDNRDDVLEMMNSNVLRSCRG